MTLESGLWNVWIGMVLIQMFGIVLMLTNREVRKRLADMSWYTPVERLFSFASIFMMVVLVVLSIWVPIKIGTWWFYLGMTIYGASFVGYIAAAHNYMTTPIGEPVVKGVYRISRNPLYFFYSTAMLGLCVASVSLPFLLVWLVYNIPTHFIIQGEERYCLETYGQAFREYMTEVPRYFLFF